MFHNERARHCSPVEESKNPTLLRTPAECLGWLNHAWSVYTSPSKHCITLFSVWFCIIVKLFRNLKQNRRNVKNQKDNENNKKILTPLRASFLASEPFGNFPNHNFSLIWILTTVIAKIWWITCITQPYKPYWLIYILDSNYRQNYPLFKFIHNEQFAH